MDVKDLGWDPLTLGEIDHRDVTAPYVRMSSYLEGAAGDITWQGSENTCRTHLCLWRPWAVRRVFT